MGWITGTDGAVLGPENLLPYADGVTAQELHDRLALALAYIANWKKAVSGASDASVWNTRFDQTAALVQAALTAMDPSLIFPGDAELATYSPAASSYVQLFDDFQLSADSQGQPGLLEQIPDYVTSVVQYPFTVVQSAADAAGSALGAVNKTVGSAVREAILALWPVLAIAAVAGAIYLFRRPIARASGAL